MGKTYKNYIYSFENCKKPNYKLLSILLRPPVSQKEEKKKNPSETGKRNATLLILGKNKNKRDYKNACAHAKRRQTWGEHKNVELIPDSMRK